jgi:hypothetical protein
MKQRVSNKISLSLSARFWVPVFILFSLSACFDDKALIGDKADQNTNLGDIDSFKGCLTGEATSTESIEIQYEWPAGASQVSVLRNGVGVFSTSSGSGGVFADYGLIEGLSYTYTCTANFYDSKTYVATIEQGTRVLTVATLTQNAPTFKGISSVDVQGSSSVLVKWFPASGVPASHYIVVSKLGSDPVSSDFDVSLSSTQTLISAGRLIVKNVPRIGSISQTTLSGLGDELNYRFAVQACTTNNLCSMGDSVGDIISKTMPDSGAPKTLGALSVSTENGGVVVTSPWSPSQGAIAKRYLYRNETGGTDLSTYTKVRTLVVADINNPPLSVRDESLDLAQDQNKTFYYILRDEDPSGQENNNTAVVSLNTGDLSPPIFNGITHLLQGTPADTAIRVRWTSIASLPDDPDGASQYLIYLSSAAHPGVPTNPCSNGEIQAQIAATGNGGDVINYDIEGLNPRYTYRVCVKARDLANISVTSNSLQRTTHDITPPSFDGVQGFSYDSDEQKMLVTWNPSPSSDIKEYRVKLWKNTTAPQESDVVTIIRSHATSASGFSFSKDDFDYSDSDVLYALVEACDDAFPNFGTQNCSTHSLATARSLTVPNTTPPAGFLGVDAGNTQSHAHGEMTVAWFAPIGNDWQNYRGFRIYYVDDSDELQWLSNCACAANNCPDEITSCTITGLDPYRTYRWHVRAYDESGNTTSYGVVADPAANFAAVRTLDEVPPVFSSSLSLVFDAGIRSAWSAASDDQYDAGSAISYQIYRKLGSSFSGFVAGSTPPVDADDGFPIIVAHPQLSYTDASTTGGGTYYYTICAADASSNLRCDGNVLSRAVSDVVPPTLSDIVSDKTLTGKAWSLSWTMSDNVTAESNIRMRIQRKVAETPDDFPLAPPFDGHLVIHDSFGSTSLNNETNISGTANLERYVNYRVTATDFEGNSTSKTISVFIDNLGPQWTSPLSLASATSTLFTQTPAVTYTKDATDASTPLVYEYAVGSQNTNCANNAACSDRKAWAAASFNSGQSITGITLMLARSYYVNFRVSDTAGNVTYRSLGPWQVVPLVRPVYLSNGADWLSYVYNNASLAGYPYNASDSVCNTASPNCIHGGELKMLPIYGYPSCEGLNVSDSLGAFDWTCSNASGVAIFYSSLKDGKSLKDLVNADSWKNNSVTISGLTGSPSSVASTPSAWWNNTIEPLPDNSGESDIRLTLGSNKIYTLSTSRSTHGYNINGLTKVAIVVLPSATLSWHASSADAAKWLFSGTANFTWFEGLFDGSTVGRGFFNGGHFANYINLEFKNGTHSMGDGTVWVSATRLENVLIKNVGRGITHLRQPYTRINNLEVRGHTGGHALNLNRGGIDAFTGTFVQRVFKNIKASCGPSGEGPFLQGPLSQTQAPIVVDGVYVGNCGNSDASLNLRNYSYGKNIVISNCRSRKALDSSNEWGNFGAIQGLLVSNCSADIVTVLATSATPANTGFTTNVTVVNLLNRTLEAGNLHNALVVNSSKSDGFWGGGITMNNLGTHSQVASMNNYYGFRGATDTKVTGNMIYGYNTQNCHNGGTNSGTLGAGTPGTCANAGQSDANWIQHSSLTVENSFVGQLVGTPDGVNLDDDGLGVALATISDFVNFANPFRTWGVSAGGFPSASTLGGCTAGTCRVWDWRLRADDDIFLNRSHAGTSVNTPAPDFSSDGNSCPHYLNGDVTLTTANASGNIEYLKNAVEIIFDPIRNPGGNNNGLCEAGEGCLYTPNFGAYQGHGELRECTFSSNGGLSGIRVWGYEHNGVQ